MAKTGTIKKLVKGGKQRTMRHTDVANEIITKLNAWINARVYPEELGEVKVADGNVIIDLSPISTSNALESYVYGEDEGGTITLYKAKLLYTGELEEVE